MEAWAWIVIAIVIIVAIVVIAWAVARTRRTERLQQQFGPEYDHAVVEQGSRKDAEAELRDRIDRREALDIQPLRPERADAYRDRWRDVQARFVDEPAAACGDADALITEVMRERGYPMDDFEQRSADISVDHPDVVTDYRAAHRIADLNADGRASTEDLRQALIHYRALFDRLVGETMSDTGATR
jgi:hypothetical protein